MMNSAGSCSDRIAFSPAGRSRDFERDLLEDRIEILGQVELRAEIELAEILHRQQLVPDCGRRSRRTRGLTVKVTSTIWSSVGS